VQAAAFANAQVLPTTRQTSSAIPDADIFGRRLPAVKPRSRPVSRRTVNFRKRIEALLARGRPELFLGDQLFLQLVFVNFFRFDQNVRAALDKLIDLAVIVQESDTR